MTARWRRQRLALDDGSRWKRLIHHSSSIKLYTPGPTTSGRRDLQVVEAPNTASSASYPSRVDGAKNRPYRLQDTRGRAFAFLSGTISCPRGHMLADFFCAIIGSMTSCSDEIGRR